MAKGFLSLLTSCLGRQLCREISTSPVMLKKQIRGPSGVHGAHKDGGYKIYKYLFLCIHVPAICALGTWVYLQRKIEEEHPHRLPFVKYAYMYQRSKRFPWGDGNHSLFHHPYYNALPEGYETEDAE